MTQRLLGFAIIIAAVAFGFIRVDEATYMQWRFVFSVGEGLVLGVGTVLIIASFSDFLL